MKKTYILLLIVFCGIHLQAKKPKVRRDSVLIENNSYLPLSGKTLTNQQKPANWFTDGWNSFMELFEPAWGSYSEGGTTNRNYPLTCADRADAQNLKEIIINKIKPGQYFDSATWNIYFKILFIYLD